MAYYKLSNYRPCTKISLLCKDGRDADCRILRTQDLERKEAELHCWWQEEKNTWNTFRRASGGNRASSVMKMNLWELSPSELSLSVNKAMIGRSELPSINQLVQEWLAPKKRRRSGSRSRLDQNRYASLINNCLWIFISFSVREWMTESQNLSGHWWPW